MDSKGRFWSDGIEAVALLIRARHIRIRKLWSKGFSLDNEKKRRKRRSDYQSIDVVVVNGPGLAFFFDKMLFRRRWPSEKNIRQGRPYRAKGWASQTIYTRSNKMKRERRRSYRERVLASWPWRWRGRTLGATAAVCYAPNTCVIFYTHSQHLIVLSLSSLFLYSLPVDNLMGWQDDRPSFCATQTMGGGNLRKIKIPKNNNSDPMVKVYM